MIPITTYLSPLAASMGLIAALNYRGTGSDSYLVFFGLLLSFLVIRPLFELDIKSLLQSRKNPLIYFWLFCLWAITSLMWSEALTPSFIASLWFLCGAMCAVLGYSWRERSFGHFVALFITLAALLAVHTLYQAYVEAIARPSGLLQNPNAQAALLNLALIPLCAVALRQHARQRLYLGPVLALLAHAIALTQSRGALMALVLGLGLLFMFSPVGGDRWRSRLSVLGWLVLGLVLDYLLQSDNLHQRLLATLSGGNPTSGRMDIWLATLGMIQEHPLLGWGIGTFHAAYPAYRPLLDGSSGQFAHNDYLQVLMELGPIGLLLLLLFVATLVRTLAPIRRHPQPAYLLGIWASSMALLTHTAFSFHLYHLSLLGVLCLYAGQLARVAYAPKVARVDAAPMPRFFDRPVYHTGVVLLLVASISVFSGYFLMRHLSVQAMADTEPDSAFASLSRAERLSPAIDRPNLTKALIILRHLDRQARGLTRQDRDYARLALDEIDRAETKNPLKPQLYWVRARLMTALPDAYRDEDIEAQYQKALSLDPFFLEGRITYHDFLLLKGQRLEAWRLLEAGWGRHYYEHLHRAIEYLDRLIALRSVYARDTVTSALDRRDALYQELEHGPYNTLNFVLKDGSEKPH